jgi:putative addiction module killer protein
VTVRIRHYLTITGRDPYQDWLDGLRDRVAAGNLGEHKCLQDGVWEFKLDIGPGYRVYYALDTGTLVLLLCGGIKRTQTADIKTAVKYWREYQQRRKV